MSPSTLVVPRVQDGPAGPAVADEETLGWTRTALAAFLRPTLGPSGLARAGGMFAGQRLRACYDAELGGDPVATLRSWDARCSVPGGDLAVDAVSYIGVRATHRRRGLLSSLLGDDLGAAAAAGTPAAVLTSTQGALYERFGFGPATWVRTLTVHPALAHFRDQEVVGRVHAAGPGELVAVAPEVAERGRRRHPGGMDRPGPEWSALATGVNPFTGMVADPHRHAAVWRDDAGRPAAYAVYRVAEDWLERGDGATLTVLDLGATSPASYRELWRHLCSLDLVGRVEWPMASVDEPLPWLLTDPRAVELGPTRPHLWLRVLDVAGVLGARRCPVGDTLELEVLDDARGGPPLGGRFTLDTRDPVAPAVTRHDPGTGPDVDLVLPAAALGSTYLGGVDPRVLARADRLSERTPGAAGRLARMLAASAVPWNGQPF